MELLGIIFLNSYVLVINHVFFVTKDIKKGMLDMQIQNGWME